MIMIHIVHVVEHGDIIEDFIIQEDIIRIGMIIHQPIRHIVAIPMKR